MEDFDSLTSLGIGAAAIATTAGITYYLNHRSPAIQTLVPVEEQSMQVGVSQGKANLFQHLTQSLFCSHFHFHRRIATVAYRNWSRTGSSSRISMTVAHFTRHSSAGRSAARMARVSGIASTGKVTMCGRVTRRRCWTRKTSDLRSFIVA